MTHKLAVSGAAFTCPQKFGQFEDPKQCDKYYECDDGVAKEKLCPDGLMFDPLNRKVNKCDQPFNVDCGDRIELRECATGVQRATGPTKLHTSTFIKTVNSSALIQTQIPTHIDLF
jgi:hypothetical protein